MADAAPTTTQGKVIDTGVDPWINWIDSSDYVPELNWPMNIPVYDKMRTDSQLAALYWATILPVTRYKYMLDPNGADPAQVEAFAADYNLDIVGQEASHRRRQKNRFSLKQHMWEAFQFLIYGHSVFEQVGFIGDDGLWHIKKLEIRPQNTISEWRLADDGGLIYIKQWMTNLGNWDNVEIPVEQLIVYAWDKQPGSWTGRSMFRDCYKNWLIKDRLIRVDAQNHERAGGVPWAEGAPGMTPKEIEQLQTMAQSFKVGEDSGAALPAGARLHLAKAAGSTVWSSVQGHDQAMARRWLAMFIDLGHDRGARSLGESFIDYFDLAQAAIADWFCDTFNEHMLEDQADWNYGENTEYVPRLVYSKSPNAELSVVDLANMVDSGLVTVDEQLEDYLRDRENLPRRDPNTARPAVRTGLVKPDPAQVAEPLALAASISDAIGDQVREIIGAEFERRMNPALLAMANKDEPIVIQQPAAPGAPDVHVTLPEINVHLPEQPDVHVEFPEGMVRAGDVHMPAIEITIPPADSKDEPVRRSAKVLKDPETGDLTVEYVYADADG